MSRPRLVLFRSLASSTHQSACLPKELASIRGCERIKGIRDTKRTGYYDGVEVNWSLLIDQSSSFLKQCQQLNLRVACKVDAIDALDARRKLDSISTALSPSSLQNQWSDTVSAMELVILNLQRDDGETPLDTEAVLTYLRNVLPISAQFLEINESIGRSHGILNAHGNPVDSHLLGVCQNLAGSLDMDSLPLVLDVLPPTRLSLDFSWLANANETDGSLEIIMEGTDHIYSSSQDMEFLDESFCLWKNLWEQRRRSGAQEFYTTLVGRSSDCMEYAKLLHEHFDKWSHDS
mmetsp:Transcript_7592/g.16144  ORF Transcript_7592/g.16144 Transcript_7592/m.16144 type:complete len:291 (-) Transcript_7592:184-1056(-)|eukprot:CAMPEP_0183326740 /NCGR_PEP_ID=MMETSP0160_2-20130417/83012_1 /TAXON_ID=2839 ORGANISM="Odontella Sinensis, Strain Grunow 1884" /NCGR_SAMPLE_ID=MMETSP0160_2 /ASSEMBLY_ACC=CAM_ASM_000250 /LENGTH=290 /DNA_ID=CAMNT_0025494789 /DNA_START=55 /DNA_END=927 /DNA_ORIENTATION=+